MPACAICAGVSKSGSPAPRPMTSLPSALRRAARAVTASVGEGLTRWTRRETDRVTGFPVVHRRSAAPAYITGLCPGSPPVPTGVHDRASGRLAHGSADPFKLDADYQPAGDQPQAIEKLVDGLNERACAPDAARRHRQRQDLHRRPRDRSACSARRWCWRTTRPWPRSCTANSASSFRTMRSSTSSPTTTTTSRKPTCRPPTPTSRRTPRSTSTSSRCASRPPRRCWSAPTRSSSPPSPRSTAWAIRRPTWPWCCIWCAATASTSAGCCAGWPTCSTRATSWT